MVSIDHNRYLNTGIASVTTNKKAVEYLDDRQPRHFGHGERKQCKAEEYANGEPFELLTSNPLGPAKACHDSETGHQACQHDNGRCDHQRIGHRSQGGAAGQRVRQCRL